MRQKGTVAAVLDNGKAELVVVRESACSGECHKCAGCGSVQQTLRLTADNLIGAQRGDVVFFESDSSVVLKGAALVYLVPLALFLAAYLAASSLGAWAGVIGAAAFCVGFLPAFAYNRKIKKRPPTYKIVGYVK